MNVARADAVARALLYEGYILYPYRRSALKNRQLVTFGTLVPRAVGERPGATDAWTMQTECLVRGDASTTIETRIRFLHLVERVDSGACQEAVEREVIAPERALGALLGGPEETAFTFAGGGTAGGEIARRQHPIGGTVERRAAQVHDGVFRVSVLVRNLTAIEHDVDSGAGRVSAAALGALASTHTLLGVRGGEFVSLLEPPDDLREAAERCENAGTWPVLIGEPGVRDTMLSSPIILYDYPRVAPESAGDFFDATEIDEMLALRILTLTDEERREMRTGDDRTREMLARTEALDAAGLGRLHGVVRTFRMEEPAVRPGARVRLRPRRRADVFDLALAGRTATVVAVEEDYEGRAYLAVTVDDDPGADLGARGWIGHRFFFHPDEVEVIA